MDTNIIAVQLLFYVLVDCLVGLVEWIVLRIEYRLVHVVGQMYLSGWRGKLTVGAILRYWMGW
jgi:hypothetical protein